MSIPPSLPNREQTPHLETVAATPESVIRNTADVAPLYREDIRHILPEAPQAGKHDDELLSHQDRINVIDNNLIRAGDAVKKVFFEIGERVQKVSQEKGHRKEWPKLNHVMDKLLRHLDKARSQAAHGEFALAERACTEAWEEFQKEYEPLEKELFDCFDEKIFDKKILKELFVGAKAAIRDSLEIARGACRGCSSYLAELDKAASAVVVLPDASVVEAALKDLSNARVLLQEILDKKREGDVEAAKGRVRRAVASCHALKWQPANMQIAKMQIIRKAKLAAALIPNATKEKIIVEATRTLGTPESPAEVELEGRKYVVAHDRHGSFQVIQLPVMIDSLGAGFSNVVILAYNTSKATLQALRRSRTPTGEEAMEQSLAIHRDICSLQGTTEGPEAVIRKGRGGALSSLYGDNAKGWLKTMPPPKYRLKAFRSAMSSFIEFAKNGNVHGDINLVNLSVGYERGALGVYAMPTILKLEDLDGACHIITGKDAAGRPIYSEKAIAAGMTPAYATPDEIRKWQDCLRRGDVEGLAEVRFPQDILSIGITLYQLLTGDIDLENLYLNMKRTPRNNRPGEDGEFISGEPNIQAIRLALEDYDLPEAQKKEIVEFIAHAVNLNPPERAKLQDFENLEKALAAV